MGHASDKEKELQNEIAILREEKRLLLEITHDLQKRVSVYESAIKRMMEETQAINKKLNDFIKNRNVDDGK